MVNARRRTIFRAIDLHHVKPEIAVPALSHKPIRARPEQIPLLAAVDAPEAACKIGMRLVRLHLDEHHAAFARVEGDYVQLAPPVFPAWAHVPTDDAPPQTGEIPNGHVLSPGRMGENPNGIPNNLMPYITKVAAGQLDHLTVFGNDYNTPDGTGVRDYIHVVDLAKGHVAACDYAAKHNGCEIINLGTGVGYSVLDIVNTFSRVNQVPVPYVIGPRRDGDVDACYADPTKAKELLDWTATKTLEDMCRDSWRWQKANPNGYQDK